MEVNTPTVIISATYTWGLGMGNVINIYKEGKVTVAVTAEYDNKLRFKIVRSADSSIIDWEQVVLCLAEAKSILKAIKKL